MKVFSGDSEKILLLVEEDGAVEITGDDGGEEQIKDRSYDEIFVQLKGLKVDSSNITTFHNQIKELFVFGDQHGFADPVIEFDLTGEFELGGVFDGELLDLVLSSGGIETIAEGEDHENTFWVADLGIWSYY